MADQDGWFWKGSADSGRPIDPAAIRRIQTLRRWAAACLAGCAIYLIAEAMFVGRALWPIWLILFAGCALMASSVLRSTRPKVSDYFMLAAGMLSMAGVIVLLITRP